MTSPPRRYFAPQVVQTSSMDCGPACLKSLLEGFGLEADYARLREACQTDVDGTSIDTLEEIAGQLGLRAQQQIVPPEHLLLAEAAALPAIVVVVLPSGATHFVVVWRLHGRWVQVMDPGSGRVWLDRRRLLGELLIHEVPVDAVSWRAWANGREFCDPLSRRMARMRIEANLLADALADDGWRSLAALDACLRMTERLVAAGGLHPGAEAERALQALFTAVRAGDRSLVPAECWCIKEGPSAEEVTLRGAVAVRIRGRQEAEIPDALRAAVESPRARPWAELIRMLREDGVVAPAVVALGTIVAAAALVFEALLLRAFVQIGDALGLGAQRPAAAVALLLFAAVVMLLELPLAGAVFGFGRRLEIRLRASLLRKLPRLGDAWFRSRVVSDVAERSHRLQEIRLLPQFAAASLRCAIQLVLTGAAIAWIDPPSAWIAALAAVLAVAVPLIAAGPLTEQDLRVRDHVGALTRFYFDALAGGSTVRAHGAEPVLEREHQRMLGEWTAASLALQRTSTGVEAIAASVGYGLAVWLLFASVSRGASAASLLLLVYWTLALPQLGMELVALMRQYPGFRNVILRLLEPLSSPDSDTPAADDAVGPPPALRFEDLTVRASSRTLLDGVSLDIPAGQHVAIVGPSGAGKSTMLGVLLGFTTAAAGTVTVDGAPLDVSRVRAFTAWVDPSVHLWNRTLLDNLAYGSEAPARRLSEVIEAADLHDVIGALPSGMQSPIGDNGGLLSGGEGQRLRYGRACMRPDARLVLLDEPFRGLTRARREQMLRHARELWRGATLLCVTHDVAETLDFPRVLVVADGAIVQDGKPDELAQLDGPYRRLLMREREVLADVWSAASWRRLRLDRGQVVET